MAVLTINLPPRRPEQVRLVAGWVAGAVVMLCLAVVAVEYGPGAAPGNASAVSPTGTWDAIGTMNRTDLAAPGAGAVSADLIAELEALSIRSEALFAENAALRDRVAALEATLARLADALPVDDPIAAVLAPPDPEPPATEAAP